MKTKTTIKLYPGESYVILGIDKWRHMIELYKWFEEASPENAKQLGIIRECIEQQVDQNLFSDLGDEDGWPPYDR